MIYGFSEQFLQLDKTDTIQLFYFVFGKKKPNMYFLVILTKNVTKMKNTDHFSSYLNNILHFSCFSNHYLDAYNHPKCTLQSWMDIKMQWYCITQVRFACLALCKTSYLNTGSCKRCKIWQWGKKKREAVTCRSSHTAEVYTLCHLTGVAFQVRGGGVCAVCAVYVFVDVW